MHREMRECKVGRRVIERIVIEFHSFSGKLRNNTLRLENYKMNGHP